MPRSRGESRAAAPPRTCLGGDSAHASRMRSRLPPGEPEKASLESPRALRMTGAP